MSVSSLFVLTAQCNVVIDKHYRGVVSRQVCDLFQAEVMKAPTTADVPPIIQTPRGYLLHIFRENMFIVGLTTADTPPLLVFEFLHRLFDVLKEYIGPINEESLRDNFVTVYQLLDEMLDGGFPFTTEPNILKEMIRPPTMANKAAAAAMGTSQMSEALPQGTLSSIPWRKTGVKYAKNEIYFDIIEEVDMTFDRNGLVSSSDISGEIVCNCRLGGMPDLTLGFNNVRLIDDCSFHPCVRYAKYEREKVLSFVPPDGQFKLMSFKINAPANAVALPIYGKSVISFSGKSGHVQLTIGSKPVGKDVDVEDVSMRVSFPRTIGNITLSCTLGRIAFDETQKELVWTIGKLPKDKTPTLTGNIALPNGPPDSSPVAQMNFRAMRYSACNLTINSLVVQEKYKPFKGVRSITKAGQFIIRS